MKNIHSKSSKDTGARSLSGNPGKPPLVAETQEYTVIGIYGDNNQGFMTVARGKTPGEAANAARDTVEDEYARERLNILVVLKGNLLHLEVPFTTDN